MAEPPIVRGTYYTLLPQIDADGNPIDGLRNIFVQVPLGTYTGWNVRKAGFSEGDSCDLTGGYIPFFRTRRNASQRATRAFRWKSAIRRTRTTWPKSRLRPIVSWRSGCCSLRTRLWRSARRMPLRFRRKPTPRFVAEI